MITHTRNIICTLLLSAMPLVAAMAQKNVKNMKNVKKTVPMACIKHPMQKDGIVRLSKIEVLPEHLDEYVVFASEVGESFPAHRAGSIDHVCRCRQGKPVQDNYS